MVFQLINGSFGNAAVLYNRMVHERPGIVFGYIFIAVQYLCAIPGAWCDIYLPLVMDILERTTSNNPLIY